MYYFFLWLSRLVGAIDRKVDHFWGRSLPDDDTIDALGRQLQREATEAMAKWADCADFGGGGD